MEKKKYPEGHFVGMWTAIGIAIFSGVGIPLSIVTKNIAFIGIGPALGVAIGISIGQSVENKYKKQGKIRPLTKKERQGKEIAVYAGIGALILGVIAFLALYMIR